MAHRLFNYRLIVVIEPSCAMNTIRMCLDWKGVGFSLILKYYQELVAQWAAAFES
jgi:hypothetical protein